MPDNREPEYIPSALEPFSAEELYRAAYRKEMHQHCASNSQVCFRVPTYEELHAFIRRPPSWDPPESAARDTVERRLVLHILYEMGAERCEELWRRFAVKAYSVIASMASAAETSKPCDGESEASRGT